MFKLNGMGITSFVSTLMYMKVPPYQHGRTEVG